MVRTEIVTDPTLTKTEALFGLHYSHNSSALLADPLWRSISAASHKF